MEWLTSLFAGPYPLITPAAIGVPIALGVLAWINSSEKERNRKGWHPVTKVLVGLLVILVVITFAPLLLS